MIRRLLDSPWTYFVAAGILSLLALASQFEISMPSREVADLSAIETLRDRDDLNVVFVLVDTLRADRLGAYGYGRPTSPILDALAASGVRFGSVVSQSSWTKTSMASLWTGTYPANHGILRYKHAIPTEATMPAEIFAEAGFRTAGIWRNGWVAPNFGFGQGFGMYMRPKPGRERAQIQRHNPSSKPLKGTDEDLMKGTFEFLDAFGQDRFFLYLHFMDLHQYVYDEEAAVFGTSYSDAYDQSVNWTDRLMGVLLRAIEDQGALDRTLVVIASDHGEAFLEHGLEGHARNLHQEVVNVPLFFIFPFLLDPGIVVNTPISNIDVWPTILDMVGLPPLPNTDGRSVLPLILEAGGATPSTPIDDLRRPIFAQLDRRWGRVGAESDPLVSVTDGDLRYFRPVESPDSAELYDRSEDPMERTNLLTSDPAAGARLRSLVDSYLEEAKSPWPVPAIEVELDEMRLEQLRALGYVIK